MPRQPLLALRLGTDGWSAERPAVGSDASCSFCGIDPSKFHLQQDDITACPLCRAFLTLNRPRIDEEFVLIWLPEVPQAAVTELARTCHGIFHAHGEAPHMMRRPRVDTPMLRSAYRAFHALLGLIPEAISHLGTQSPRDLWAALSGLPRDAIHTISPVRLLPLGHYFEDGRDIYPDILDASKINI